MNVESTGPPAAPSGTLPEPARTGDGDASHAAAATRVSLSIEQAEPLVGTAACARGTTVPFVGWLELLRAVSTLVDAEGRQDSGHQADDT